MSKLILASASPRREELLKQIGYDFAIEVCTKEEVTTKEKPYEVVMELAKQKAREVMNQHPNEDVVVIGADTVVVYWNQIMGKPADEANAKEMLSLLQGKTHQVYTGVCIYWKEDGVNHHSSFYEATDVTMFPMDMEEIEAYVASGEPMDKAGAYGIQGKCAAYIQAICGDYNNVVGLPVGRVYQEMKKLGLEITND